MCEIWGPFPELLPMGGEATQSQPEVWPSCVSSLPGARRETLVGLADRPGPSRRDSSVAAPAFLGIMHGGDGTAAFERDPWTFWPLSMSPLVMRVP